MIFKKGAMFGLDCRVLKKQFGELFLASRQSEPPQGANGSCGYTKRGAMFGLDARIALAIFGALSVISGAALYSAIEGAKVTAYMHQAKEVEKAIEAYFIDTGTYPAVFAEDATYMNLNSLINKPSGVTGWKGPYISGELEDTQIQFVDKTDSVIRIGEYQYSAAICVDTSNLCIRVLETPYTFCQKVEKVFGEIDYCSNDPVYSLITNTASISTGMKFNL
tara:strand:- start:559 stop:1221 length:663 start_codon:yes stop_codon:yes gene_type:complete